MTGLILLLVQVLDLAAVMLDALRVIYRDRDVAGQSLQDFDLRAREGIEIVMRRTKNTDDPVAHFQWNDDLRAGIRFTGAVKEFLGDIGSVVGLAGGNHLRRQTLGDRPALALVRLGAAVHGGEMELIS